MTILCMMLIDIKMMEEMMTNFQPKVIAHLAPL